MGKIALRIFLLPALTLAVTQAQGATFWFKSKVPLKNWSRTIGGELFFPKGKGPFPVVIFLHPCAGITPPVRKSMRTHARYLARHGFATLALDSFGPRGLGGGKACGPPLGTVATVLVLHDAFNAKVALGRSAKIDGNNIFVAGQSLGAGAALRAATKSQSLHDGAFRAVVAWYPSCYTLGYVNELKSLLLVLGAGKDDWTPPNTCEYAKKDGRMTGADFKVIVYKGALHGFDQPFKRHRYKGH